MDNFQDPKTGQTFFFSFHRSVHRNGVWVTTDKNGKELTNPETGTPLEFIEVEKDFSEVSVLKSNNKETRQAMLQKRSKDHFKKEISEQKYQKNVDLIKKFEDK